MSTNMFRRTLVSSVAVAAALGLAACNSDGPAVSDPTDTTTTTTTTTTAPTDQDTTSPETDTDPTSQGSQTQESSASDESSTTDSSAETEVSDPHGRFAMGEPAVIQDGDDTFRLTPTALEVAPDSVYAEHTKLKKSNGTVYYLRFKVTPITVNSTYFGTNSINGLFFHPEVGATVKGAKRLYGDTSSCQSDTEELSVGQTGSSCFIYQIPGQTVTDVVYADHSAHNIRWSGSAQR